MQQVQSSGAVAADGRPADSHYKAALHTSTMGARDCECSGSSLPAAGRQTGDFQDQTSGFFYLLDARVKLFERPSIGHFDGI